MSDLNTVAIENNAAAKRLSKDQSPTFDARAYIARNIYPLNSMLIQAMAGIAQHLHERVTTLEVAFAERVMQGESLILPELGGEIFDVFDAAEELAKKVVSLALDDDLTKEATELLALIENAAGAVDAVLVEGDDEEDPASEESPGEETPEVKPASSEEEKNDA